MRRFIKDVQRSIRLIRSNLYSLTFSSPMKRCVFLSVMSFCHNLKLKENICWKSTNIFSHLGTFSLSLFREELMNKYWIFHSIFLIKLVWSSISFCWLIYSSTINWRAWYPSVQSNMSRQTTSLADISNGDFSLLLRTCLLATVSFLRSRTFSPRLSSLLFSLSACVFRSTY